MQPVAIQHAIETTLPALGGLAGVWIAQVCLKLLLPAWARKN